MTESFKAIYLSWRRGRSSRRHIIGKLITDNSTMCFTYLEEGVRSALVEGFTAYTEFPDTSKSYDKEVLNILAQRLTPSSRATTSVTANFWEVPQEMRNNKLAVLAYTQGLLPTDSYEFLADFEPTRGLSFVTDLAGLSHIQVPIDFLNVGDTLQWIHETDNLHDPDAILVSKQNQKIGYIKRIHSNPFKYYNQDSIRLSVRAIEKNGVVKNIFVTVNFL